MKRQLPRFLRYDPSLGRISTPRGELSLKRLFLPLFLESLLLNLMGPARLTFSRLPSPAVTAPLREGS